MVFQQIQPPEALQNHVRYFWTLEGTCPASLTKTFATIADGCPGFVFQQSDHGMFYDGGMALPETFLYGQTTQYREIATTGRFRLLGAYLWPNALKSVFGLPADELTDGCLDLQLLPDRDGFQLPEQLSETTDAHRQCAFVSAYLLEKIRKNNTQLDWMTQFAMQQIMDSNGAASLKELQRKGKISERGLERRFRQSVGIPPKLFARICQFQASMRQLRDCDYDKLSDVAFENGFADQSHFIRVFKNFGGISAQQYLRQSHEIVENFPELRR